MSKPHQELIAKEGWVFLIPLVLLTLVSLWLRWPVALTLILAMLSAFVGYFFRNPYRQIPEDSKAVVSPADGKVVGVHRLEDGRQLISIFLNIFSVHINRCPIGGRTEQIRHKPGQFKAAYKPDASQVNERNSVSIRDGEFQIEVIQIAGLIARRIVCWSKEGDQVVKGQRFGLIRFGSRVDLILPEPCELLVKPGDKVKGGSDIIAERG